jgi:hypothetical protein
METQQKNRILAQLKKLGSISKVCENENITRMAYYRTCDKDPIFKGKSLKNRTDWMLKND